MRPVACSVVGEPTARADEEGGADPEEPSLFGPGSVTWRVHAHPSALVGGLRALLVQALDSRAMAGVVEHSDYQQDPWGRLRSTSDFVVRTTFAGRAEAELAGAQVRAVHQRVRGTDPFSGRPYDASDPELLRWVHLVEVDSFLAAYQAYGGRLSEAERDRYVVEMGRAAELVGLDPSGMPRSAEGVRAAIEARGDLVVTSAAAETARLVLSPPMPPALVPLWGLAARGALAILPPSAARLWGVALSWPERAALGAALPALSAIAELVVPRHPLVQRAQRRMDSGSRPAS